MAEKHDELRRLPAVDRIIDALTVRGPHALLAQAARAAIDRARTQITTGEPAPSFDEVVSDARSFLKDIQRGLLLPVVNATGVLVHTNLGRVPLGNEQLNAVRSIASGYSNLEYDLPTGRRGNRYSHASHLLTTLTGAEDSLVVNNNAAAVLLVLAGLCSKKEVVISRGELIEIGGEFRIPDVMEISGARLVEVGTTNRTHLADYERAIGENTGAILKVHPSNYRVVGFTATVGGRDLARLAKGRGLLFLHDLGSGLLTDSQDPDWMRSEPPVETALADGADVVTFSGDKLLGGPQAGVILGRKELIARLSRHPLLRTVRVDKMTLAALEATLSIYLEGRDVELPLWQMALATPEELGQRARSVATRVAEAVPPGAKVEPVATRAVTGGGSLPGAELGSWAVAITHGELAADEIEQRLRRSDPPVIGRIEDDRVLLDMRTVAPEQDDYLAETTLRVLE
ncbi:MAG: L-seryl-tRNA(Sec) selenium transferase [Actinomycetota bacterium]|nr:L-seryl-tRNA(Sec) selenium transferase [Actinomycetota bacterium]